MGSSSVPFLLARRLEGKVALLTGGASGLGECAARLFSQHGAKVVIADIQDDLGHSLSKDLGPSVATFVHCDVTDESNVQNAVDTAVTKYGKLDIMFNNAGISDPIKQSILETKKKDFERVLTINAIGTYLGTKHAARVMIPARSGSIITTGSVCSVMGGVGPHAYVTSKHALMGLMKNAAVELGQFGIRVNCVSPHVVATPMSKSSLNGEDEEIENFVGLSATLKGVTLKREDIAQAVLYLASDDARYVSGHNLLVDGGYSIVNPLMGLIKVPES